MFLNDRNLKFFKVFLFLFVIVNFVSTSDKAQSKKEPNDQTKQQGHQSKKQEEDQCQLKLLSNYQLEGLEAKQQPQDMIICKNIKAKNNCCSKTDEMKILINWAKYSEPKLNRYKSDILLAYEKFLNVDSFVKNMKGDLIDYHFYTFVWQKIKQTKCFSSKFFLEETKMDQLIDEEKSQNWIDIWANKIKQNIITDLVDVVNKSKLMTPKDLKSNIVDNYNKDKKLTKLIKKLQNDFSLEQQIAEIKKIVENIFLTSPQSSFNFKGKSKNETNIQYLEKTMNYTNLIKSTIFPKLQEKELRNLKKETSVHQMKNIEKFFVDNADKIITNKQIPNNKKTNLLQSIIGSLKSNDDLVYYLRFQYDPEIFNNNHRNHATFQSVSGTILQSVEKSILDLTDIPNLNPYNLFQETLKNLGKEMNTQALLQRNQYQVVLSPIMVQMYSKLVKNTVEEIKKRKLKNDDKKSLEKSYNSSFKQFKQLDFKKMKFDVKNYKKFIDLKQQICDKIESKWNLSQDQIPSKFRKKYKSDEIKQLFDKVLSEFQQMVSKDDFLSQKKGDKVCAEVTKHALVKRQNFNKEKYFYCAWSQKRLFDFNYETLLLEFEDIKSEIQKVLEMKKSLYCSLCDRNLNQFFNSDSKTITYSQDFCFNVLTQFKKYLIWKNKLFIQYSNLIFQYLKCFSSEGGVDKFPFDFFGESDLKLVTQVEQCTKLTDKSKIQMCQDLCQKFNIANYSAFWDGEMKFVERVYDFVLNVIRNFGFRFKKEEKIEIEKPIHLATNIDIADLQDLKKDEQQFIEDLKLNKKDTLFQYVSMRVAKPKPKALIGKKRILSIADRIKKHRYETIPERNLKESTSVPRSNYQKRRRFFRGYYRLYRYGKKDEAEKWIKEYLQNLEKAKSYYYVKLITYYKDYYGQLYDYRKQNRRKKGQNYNEWRRTYYTGYYDLQEKIQSKFYDEMKKGYPSDNQRQKEYRNILYTYVKKKNKRYKQYLKDRLRKDGESYKDYRGRLLDGYYDYLKEAARYYKEFRATKRSYQSESTHKRISKYWTKWLDNRLELLELRKQTRRKYKEKYKDWRKRYLTALYAYRDRKKQKYFDKKTELYKNSPNSQKKMDALKREIKRYERYKLYRIRPGETRAEHRARVAKLREEERRKREEERRKREEARRKAEEARRKAEEERRRKAEEERRRKAEEARRAAEAGRRAAEGAARLKRKQAREQIRKDIDAQEIINYFDDKEKEIEKLKQKELQEVQDKMKIKPKKAALKQVKKTSEYKVGDIKNIKKILEQVISKPKFSSKNYDKVNEIENGQDLIQKNENISLGQFEVLIAKDGLNLIEILSQTNFDINLLGTFLKEEKNVKRTKEPLDKEVIRDYLMANKPITEAFNQDFNLEISKEFKSDEVKEEQPKEEEAEPQRQLILSGMASFVNKFLF